ncbi:methyltransferase domain-containing protein [Methylosinus sp. LW3]|uniref:class I SAM-dependent methyltransferase n=2 Tax=Methylosinus TaxID=425 RepID=UPI000A0485A3|nr:methyltransferase domain-containing protein [Methylosinus sp. LW3]
MIKRLQRSAKGFQMSRLQYLLRSALRFADPAGWICPNCGSAAAQEIDRKFLVTRLMRCDECRLQFRGPTDTEEFNKIFYNFHYQEGTAMICPSDTEIAALTAANFAGSERDFSRYVGLLKRHGVAEGDKVFDFGCSWGYGSYQFARAGYDVESYEIAEDRRNYGIAKLGVRHVDDPFAIDEEHPLYNSFDCFFSAHVLEHVPAPSKVFDLAWKCLRLGGVFIAVAPNGSARHRERFPQSWRTMWGGVHPNFLDDVFYDAQFSRSRRRYESPSGGDPWENYELGFIAFKGPDQDRF